MLLVLFTNFIVTFNLNSSIVWNRNFPILLLFNTNVVTQRSSVQGKGCAAYVKAIEAQIQVYQLQHNKIPSLKELTDEKYITTDKCPNGESIHISDDGAVSIRAL